MFTTFRFVFPDFDTGFAALRAAGLAEDFKNDEIPAMEYRYDGNVHVIGMDPWEGERQHKGWHVDWLAEECPKALDEYRVTPATPMHAFAGVE